MKIFHFIFNFCSKSICHHCWTRIQQSWRGELPLQRGWSYTGALKQKSIQLLGPSRHAAIKLYTVPGIWLDGCSFFHLLLVLEMRERERERVNPHLHFTQLCEEMIKQASFGLAHLTINNRFGNGITKTCTDHIDIRQYGCSCWHNVKIIIFIFISKSNNVKKSFDLSAVEKIYVMFKQIYARS